MKMQVEWHKEGLANSRDFANRLRKEIERKAGELKKIEERNAFLALQIETAEKEGKDGFDRDRYLKEKK